MFDSSDRSFHVSIMEFSLLSEVIAELSQNTQILL